MSEGEIDLGIIKPTHVHKVGLAIKERTFNPIYKVLVDDINSGKYDDLIFLKREFSVNPTVGSVRLDDGYKQASETAFKLNAIYKDILGTLNARWELELFIDWLEGNNTAFDIYEDAYRDLSLIKGNNYDKEGTGATESTKSSSNENESKKHRQKEETGETRTEENREDDIINEDKEIQEGMKIPKMKGIL